MNHHAFVIEAGAEEGIEKAKQWLSDELDMRASGNPDVVVLSYGLLSVEDARRISEVACGAPFVGEHKAVIISADRAYHEAQNALLKVFEEPPKGTYLFLIMPTLGGLLPTLRSRVVELEGKKGKSRQSELVQEFLKGREKRTAVIKKLTAATDEEERRENREETIRLLNDIERAAYSSSPSKHAELLSDIAELRRHLYDRSAPVKMILEHLSLVIPRTLL